MRAAQVTLMPLLHHLDRIVTEWRRLIGRARDGYRPERYYMRGPGPKWHAKHRAAAAVFSPRPA